jgi:hypothetical protein
MSKLELIQRIVEGHPNEIARKDLLGFFKSKRGNEAVGALFRAASGTPWDHFVVDNLKARLSNIRQRST